MASRKDKDEHPAAVLPVRHERSRTGDTLGEAVFAVDGRYRYRLRRRWARGGRQLAVVLLNPNRADARHDDPTIRRCIAFSRSWGYAALEVVNLFAWCAPKPALLRKATQPVGPLNDRYIRTAVRRADAVLLAWGAHGALHGRDRAVLELMADSGRELCCLGYTRAGQPRHVLYLPGDLRPVPFRSE